MTTETIADRPPTRQAPGWGAVALVVLVGSIAASLAIGAVDLSWSDVVAVLGRRLGLSASDPGFQADAVVWNLRLPRAVLGVVVGGGLSVGGLVLQTLHRNPLADPQLLGIGPGAAIGAALGSSAGGVRGAIAGGAVAGVMAALLSRRVVRRHDADPARAVLMGVALGAALTAWVGFVVFAGDRTTVPPMEFWLLGSLSATTWDGLAAAAPVTVLVSGALWLSGRTIDVFGLGEAVARQLGVDVPLVASAASIAVGVLVGTAVGAVGVIGFVGLLGPFLARRVAGPVLRRSIPIAFLIGGIVTVLADLLARSVISPVEIPVGLVTATVGGPVFLWMARRVRGLV